MRYLLLSLLTVGTANAVILDTPYEKTKLQVSCIRSACEIKVISVDKSWKEDRIIYYSDLDNLVPLDKNFYKTLNQGTMYSRVSFKVVCVEPESVEPVCKVSIKPYTVSIK